MVRLWLMGAAETGRGRAGERASGRGGGGMRKTPGQYLASLTMHPCVLGTVFPLQVPNTPPLYPLSICSVGGCRRMQADVWRE